LIEEIHEKKRLNWTYRMYSCRFINDYL